MSAAHVDKSSASDESLAAAARNGQRSAMETLVRRWQVPLVGLLERRTGNRSDAEDLFQETFVRVQDNLSSYDPRRPFKTWILTIAWRLAANHLRDRKAAIAFNDVERADTRECGPLHAAAEKEAAAALWDIAQRLLSADQFAMLWLYYVENLSAQEIARVTGKSWIAVKTAMHRARRALRPALADMAVTVTAERMA